MSTGTTPSLGLLLGDDSAENENWQKLDRVYRALFRDIIPDNVVIQGDLEVTGNTQLDGSLTVLGPTVLHGASMDSLTVNQAITLPTGALDAVHAVQPGTGIYTAQTGFAQTNQVTLTPTYQDLCEIILSPSDDSAFRWELVIASLSFQIGMGADVPAGVNQSVQMNLKRGQTSTIVVQSRQANYTYTRAQYLEYPLTMVRLTKPPLADAPRWAIEGRLVQPVNALNITRVFGQLSVLQFL